jgi:26S proteasome regulatory subunit N2
LPHDLTEAKAKAKLKAVSTGTPLPEDDDVDMKDATEDEGEKKDDDDKKESEKKEEQKKEEPEPNSFTLSNPSRVTYAQYEYVTPTEGTRYRPVIASKRNLGVVVLTDSTPNVEDDALMEIEAPPKSGAEGPEPPCPEPFDWTPPVSIKA